MDSQNVPQGNPLGYQPIKSMLWKFAVPGILSSLMNAAHNIVDQVFVGQGIGDLGIAATNIAFPLATITTALAGMLGMGGASSFNLALGRGNTEEARKSLGGSLFLMATVGIVIAAAAVSLLEPMLNLFGVTEAILPYAEPYVRIISLGIPLGIFATGASYHIRADGSPSYASATILCGVIFNMIFDPVFLYVFDLGISGIALATVGGQALSTLLALCYFLRKFKNAKPGIRDLPPRLNVIKRVCSLGSAVCVMHLSATVIQIVQLNTLRHYGALSVYGSEVALAAAGAAAKVTTVFMSCVIGIALGCQPIYGFNYGNKKFDRVKEAYKLALRYGTTIAVATFLCLQLFPTQILSIFSSDDSLFYSFATRYLRVFLFMTFINAIQPITSNFFSAIGKAKLGFWTALLKQIGLLLPLLLLLPLAFGIEGLFWAGPITDSFAAVVVISLAAREVRALTKLQQEQTGEKGEG
jgi:putative MATE family efflux protein